MPLGGAFGHTLELGVGSWCVPGEVPGATVASAGQGHSTQSGGGSPSRIIREMADDEEWVLMPDEIASVACSSGIEASLDTWRLSWVNTISRGW